MSEGMFWVVLVVLAVIWSSWAAYHEWRDK